MSNDKKENFLNKLVLDVEHFIYEARNSFIFLISSGLHISEALSTSQAFSMAMVGASSTIPNDVLDRNVYIFLFMAAASFICAITIPNLFMRSFKTSMEIAFNTIIIVATISLYLFINYCFIHINLTLDAIMPNEEIIIYWKDIDLGTLKQPEININQLRVASISLILVYINIGFEFFLGFNSLEYYKMRDHEKAHKKEHRENGTNPKDKGVTKSRLEGLKEKLKIKIGSQSPNLKANPLKPKKPGTQYDFTTDDGANAFIEDQLNYPNNKLKEFLKLLPNTERSTYEKLRDEYIDFFSIVPNNLQDENGLMESAKKKETEIIKLLSDKGFYKRQSPNEYLSAETILNSISTLFSKHYKGYPIDLEDIHKLGYFKKMIKNRIENSIDAKESLEKSFLNNDQMKSMAKWLIKEAFFSEDELKHILQK